LHLVDGLRIGFGLYKLRFLLSVHFEADCDVVSFFLRWQHEKERQRKKGRERERGGESDIVRLRSMRELFYFFLSIYILSCVPLSVHSGVH